MVGYETAQNTSKVMKLSVGMGKLMIQVMIVSSRGCIKFDSQVSPYLFDNLELLACLKFKEWW